MSCVGWWYVATPNVITLLNVIIIKLGGETATPNAITVIIITYGVAAAPLNVIMIRLVLHLLKTISTERGLLMILSG
jgi:hypothetical protein